MSRCPSDALLVAAAAGDASAKAVAAAEHARGCAACAGALGAFSALHAKAPEPGPFASARMARNLESAIDGEVRAQWGAWRVPRVAAAMAVAALSGAALATVAVRRAEPAPSPQPPSAVVAEADPTPAAPVELALAEPEVDLERDPDADEASPTPEPVVTEAPPPEPSALARAERDWAQVDATTSADAIISVGDRLRDAGAPERAADAYVEALARAGESAAGTRLARLLRGRTIAADALLDRLADNERVGESADGMRLRCEWGLKYRGDRRAVADCQAFGRSHPTHPAVRVLALAAGKAAESRLGDLELAVEEYSRALLVSEYAGVSGTHALLARARARARLGDRAEAEADLRLYLHATPESWNRQEIRDLADELGVEREP